MDKPHFTPEQIDEYCKTIHGFTTPPMTGTEVWLVKGVQIIKQLQAELAGPVFLGDMPAGTVAMSRLQGCDGD